MMVVSTATRKVPRIRHVRMMVRLPLVGYSIGALGVRSLIDTSSWLMTCEGEVILAGFEGCDLGSLDKGSVLLPGENVKCHVDKCFERLQVPIPQDERQLSTKPNS